MARNQKIDRSEVHRILWGKADDRGYLLLVHNDFAVELGCTYSTVSLLMSELADKGWVKRLGRDAVGVKYHVTEPGDTGPSEKPAPRRLVPIWG